MIKIFKKLFRKKRKQIRLRESGTGKFRKRTIYDDPLVRERMEYEASKLGVTIDWKRKPILTK